MISGTIYSDKDVKSPVNYVRATFQYTVNPSDVVLDGRAVSFIVNDTAIVRKVCEESANITYQVTA